MQFWHMHEAWMGKDIRQGLGMHWAEQTSDDENGEACSRHQEAPKRKPRAPTGPKAKAPVRLGPPPGPFEFLLCAKTPLPDYPPTRIYLILQCHSSRLVHPSNE